MHKNFSEIARAKELLDTVLFAAMATVNEDGSPHNTPFLFMHDHALTTVYWGSHPDSQHSKNILRTGQLFIVIYDAFKKGGLYLKAKGGHILEGDELDVGLAIHNEIRKKHNQEPLANSYYIAPSPQRMWSAAISNYWINSTEKGTDGHLLKDFRIEIQREDLLNKE